ncbi:hypothetical protein C8A01DRAFT_51156 [Parachaetomium inaequale]|uniref:Uncharacterized protein n=1 Tax=Parachaetomium inaequale TaxID=2588326 RepID=A0AAN6P7R0_9PEZI|nr:hypothetical protein C8A01DRAFT_51156 [Parachaetomium inaequale]
MVPLMFKAEWSIEIDSRKPPPEEDSDPSLRTVGDNGRGAVDAPVPELRVATEARFADFDKSPVTHVVIQVTTTRQRDISRYVGYRYDWKFPSPFWAFLGKIAEKGVFDDDGATTLKELRYIPVGRREFIAYTTPLWRAAVEAIQAAKAAAAAGAGIPELPPISALEVTFKKPQHGQPLEMTWIPVRPLITARIKRWNDESDDEENVDVSD